MRTILINRVSWGAVAAGVVVALVAQLILNMLGIGLGAATLDPAADSNLSASSFSIGAAQAIGKAQSIPVEHARSQVAEYEQQYPQAVEQAKQKAIAAADTATKAVSRGALFGALALTLAAIAAWFGGRMGVVHPTLTSELLMRTQRRLH